jgi:hypothetical protein
MAGLFARTRRVARPNPIVKTRATLCQQASPLSWANSAITAPRQSALTPIMITVLQFRLAAILIFDFIGPGMALMGWKEACVGFGHKIL